MKFDPAKSVSTISTLLLVLGLAALSHALSLSSSTASVREWISEARGRHSFGGEEGNGYYENLMHGRGSDNGSVPIKQLTQSKLVASEKHEGDIYSYGGFLLYRAKPNLNFDNTVEGPVQTNSYGLFDHQYSLEKLPGVRRIAILGDSVTKGWGVSLDERYTNLLEKKLNANGEEFQLLNFSQPGYVLTQMLDVITEKAEKFHPDVYMLALTNITGGVAWDSHLIQLVNNGQDLKYDLLRKAAAESSIQKGDETQVERFKLSRYRETTLHDLLLQIKKITEERSAKLIVVLVPSAEAQVVLDPGFQPLRQSLEDTGIPVVDLSRTFEGTDIDELRRDWHDPHPNVEAHRMLADNFYRKLQQNPEAWAAITGICEAQSAKAN